MNANSSKTNKTVGAWLSAATSKLQKAGIATAHLDCLVLLEDTTKRDRSWLLAHGEEPLSTAALTKLNNLLERRSKHLPLAYLRAKSEFYGRTFMINQHVLVPRPETETMLELLKDTRPPQHVIDVGTGSGALAITAALEWPSTQVTATDIDPACLQLAQQNAQKLGAQVQFLKSNLLTSIAIPQGCLVLANLPYVPDDYPLNQAARHEPRLALFAGPDGLDLYKELFTQLASHIVTVVTEALPLQHEPLAKVALRNGFVQKRTTGLIQVFEPTITTKT